MNLIKARRTIICDKGASGVFFRHKSEEKGLSITDQEFTTEIKRWKAEHGVKFLRGYIAKGGLEDDDKFWTPTIKNYLSRRSVEVNKWNLPVINKYERVIYLGLEERMKISFDRKLPYSAFISIPYRDLKEVCDGELSEIRNNKLDKISNSNMLSEFNLGGTTLLPIEFVVRNNSKELKDLGEKSAKITYVTSINRHLSAKDWLINTINEYKKTDAHFDKKVPYTVHIQAIQAGNHATFYVFVLDNENRKINKVINFNSWPHYTGYCEFEEISSIVNRQCSDEDKIEFVSINYGSQVNDQKNNFERDGNCALYTLNAINALIELLLNENSLSYKMLLKNESISSITSSSVFDYNIIKGACIYMVKGLIKVLSQIIVSLLVSILLDKNIAFALWSISLIMLINFIRSLIYSVRIDSNPLKLELQQALPQYFKKEGDKMKVRDWDERRDNHFKDRWLIGNEFIEEHLSRLSNFANQIEASLFQAFSI